MREEKWVVSAKRADFQKIGQEYGIDPVIARLIRNREVQSSEQIDQYLNGKVEDLPSPWFFKDMESCKSYRSENTATKVDSYYWRL